MIDIVAIGEPLIEFNQTEPSRPDHFLRGFGGDTSNAAIAAARQGARVAYVTLLGMDRFGEAFLDLWQREGVDTSAVRRRDDAPTGLYFVEHDEKGHHFSYRRAGSAASLMRPAELPDDLIRKAKIIQLSGISQAISPSACDSCFRAIDIAHEAGVKVAYDTNLRPALWPLARARAIIGATIAKTEILLPGIDDMRLLTGEEEPERIMEDLMDRGPSIVALTLGEQGVLLGVEGRVRRIAAHRVDAKDATGAGDTFDGAFLARLVAGDEPDQAARYASVAAALATTGFGAIAPIPRRDQVEAALTSAQS
ncbi:MAG: sugar kinase [Geminicoccaceae bacterium]